MLRTEPGTDDRFVVTTRLTGNFPVSPLEQRCVFTLRGELISKLQIE